MSLRVLLLQARNPDDPMAAHEHRCFVNRTGLAVENVVCFDLCQGTPTWAEVRRHDALMVGGSGEYYVSKRNLPGHDRVLDLMREVASTGHPTFASCFGYQCMVQALGGTIVHDPERTEVGSYELTVTEDGRRDSLFGELPERFWAQMGHKDRAEDLPADVANLASSELNPFQALRIPGKAVWASQFHPELERKTNQERLIHYMDGYAPFMTAEERSAALERFRDSVEASRLLSRFIELVFD